MFRLTVSRALSTIPPTSRYLTMHTVADKDLTLGKSTVCHFLYAITLPRRHRTDLI